MPVKIAVCDDSGADVRMIAALTREWADARNTAVRISSFSSAEAFLFQWEEEKDFDLLLLDIEMEKMDGVTLARRIRKENEAVQIVFITGYMEYIAEGYEVAALHYLLKPIDARKFFAVLDRAMEKIARGERFLMLSTAEETVKVPLREIRYLDVRRNYTTVHAKKDYTVKRTLSELSGSLDGCFFRAGRSLTVNLEYIRRVTRTEMYLSDGTVLPMPAGQYDAINRAIIAYS